MKRRILNIFIIVEFILVSSLLIDNYSVSNAENATNTTGTTTTTNVVTDGIYTIQSAINNKFVLDISCGSFDNCANLQLWENSTVAQQQYKVKSIGNGLYTISVLSSDKVLDVAGAGKTDGTNVQQYSSNNSDAQKWIIKDVGNGYYSIISKCNGLYLDAAAGRAANGTNITTYTGNGTNAQKFKFVKVEQQIASGNYTICTEVNEKYVLDISSASKSNCANLQIWECVSEPQQQYKISYLDGFYKITNINSGKVLDVAGAGKSDGTNVQQYDSNDTNAQKWFLKKGADGKISLISKCNGLYLDVDAGRGANGTNVQTYSGNGTNSQRFQFNLIETGVKSISDGIYTIRSGANDKYVLDVAYASFAENANVQLWTDVSASEEKFRVNYLNNGCYQITAIHSNKSLDVQDAGMTPGTNVQQHSLNGSSAQQWIIKDLDNGYYSVISKCNNLYLDILAGTPKDGANIQVYSGNGSDAQKFKFVKSQSNLNIDTAKYPGYKEKLQALQNEHPNWHFEFLYTGVNFNDAVKGEASLINRNLVPSSYSGEWINETNTYDTGSWYAASSKAIAYYLDVRNFLNDTSIFQFQNVNEYIPESYTIDGISKKVTSTYLENYANDIYVACKNKNVNPYYIISRLLQEQGTKETRTGTGMNGGDGKTYYDPFNINASGTDYLQRALNYAKSQGWDTMEKSLEGGIDFCKKNWLENYQNTLYQNRFDIDTRNGSSLYTHQYMQNLLGAYSESLILKSCYTNTSKIDSDYVFIIPLFEGMSSTVSPLPSDSNVDISGTKAYVKTNDGSGCNSRKGPGTSYNYGPSMNEGATFYIQDNLATTSANGYNWYRILLTNNTEAYIPKEYTAIY